MRFLPLLSSTSDPAPWFAYRAVDLAWAGPGPWTASRDREVHAVHLPAGGDLLEKALEVLRQRLDPDFLVLPASVPAGRMAESAFLGLLEALLEVHGPKVALRAAPGAAGPLRELLRRVRADAVGFCWDGETGSGLEALSDRLFCAVGGPGVDARDLQRLGYRWGMAIPGEDPREMARVLADLEARFPPVLFPFPQERP
jgi:hypothetical protein